MTLRRAALIVVAGAIAASCSEKSAPDAVNNTKTSEMPREPVRLAKAADGKAELTPPSEGEIGKDCVAFVRSTKAVAKDAARADCPGCPVGGAEVLSVRQIKTDAVSCAEDRCNVVVTIRVAFNRGPAETLAGGLTAWIPPEQRSAYLNGQAPAEEQVYRVQITYRHRDGVWRPIDFERASE